MSRYPQCCYVCPPRSGHCHLQCLPGLEGLGTAGQLPPEVSVGRLWVHYQRDLVRPGSGTEASSGTSTLPSASHSNLSFLAGK